MCRTTRARPIFWASSSTWSALGSRDRHQVRGDRGQEGLAEMIGQGAGQAGHVVTGLGGLGHTDEGPARVPVGQGVGQGGQHDELVVDGAPRRHLVQSGEGVAGRSPAPADGGVDRVVVETETGVVTDLAEETDEDVGPEQPELEVLGPAPDGGEDLLGFGGGQDEDDVTGGLLQGLEQSVGRRRREHVDLVDDVDLPAARRAQSGVGHQFAHGVDTVVGGGVQLVDVERRPPGDLDTGVADPAGFSALGRRAVEGLGQDAGRRCLARAPGATEQVGVADPVVADGVAKSQSRCVPGPAPPRTAGGGSAGRATGTESMQSRLRGPPRQPTGRGSDPMPGTDRCSVRRPGLLRHTDGAAESCCLPALTRFTGARCAGPGRRTEHRAVRVRR